MAAVLDEIMDTQVATALKRCAIYVRVSTEKQVDRESLTHQERQLTAYAELHDWSVARVFTDAGLSGKDTRRPALQQLLRAAQRGEIDVVLVSKVDRISRNLSDLLALLADLVRWNVDFVCASQSFDTSSAMGKLTLNMLGSFAEFERQVTGERTRENMRERARGGAWGGGAAPFGYRRDEEAKTLVPDPAEAKAVRAIYEDYAVRGSILGTVHAINAARLRTRKGKPWALTSVLREKLGIDVEECDG